MDLSDPSTIGRYRVKRKLGEGGMGQVYLAIDADLDRAVAIKTLRATAHQPGGEEMSNRFLREARAIAQASHPNVVAIHDLGRADALTYIVMEFVDGRSLADVIDASRGMPIEQAFSIMRQLLGALDHLHRTGIIHRDVKPSNVLIDEIGQVKLTDFGIARPVAARGLTRVGLTIGTPSYMSPEQITLPDSVDHRTDLYSAGVLLHEMLTGRVPSSGSEAESDFAVLQRILMNEVKPPSIFRPEITPALDQVVLKALRRDPAERFQSGAEFAAALEGVNVGEASARKTHRPSKYVDRTSLTTRLSVALSSLLAAFSGRHAQSADAAGPTAERSAAPAPPPAAPARLHAQTVTVAALPAAERTEAKPDGPGPADSGTVFFQVPTALGAIRMDRPRAQLIVTSGDARHVGQRIAISEDRFVIGRDAGELLPDDPTWSRRHAVIEFVDGGYRIADLGSTNGTLVNGRQVGGEDEASPLLFGSSIRVGMTTFMFSTNDDTSLPDLAGLVVAGRYRLERLVRESARSAVYAAMDDRVGRQVALKLLSPHLATYPAYRQQYERETALARRLQHPHICKIHDCGEEAIAHEGQTLRTPFLCFEYLAGGSLSDRLKAASPMALVAIATMVAQVAEGLHHAHRNGVVHGDIKPGAICFDVEDNAYLTDFACSRMDEVGAPLLGTPAYMAPEQWGGASITPRVDQFSLAVVAYYLVAGALPFEGQERPELRERNFRIGAAPVAEEAARHGRADVSRAVSDVLGKALSTPVDDRFESVDQFAVALSAALRGEGRVLGAFEIFISYQRESSAGWATLIARELASKHGIRAFVDTERRDGASIFPARLAKAIQDCDVFVCLLSSSTLASSWVRRELEIARVRGRPMIPVFQESWTPLDENLADEGTKLLLSYDGVHLLDRRNIHVDHTIQDLADLVKRTPREQGASR